LLLAALKSLDGENKTPLR